MYSDSRICSLLVYRIRWVSTNLTKWCPAPLEDSCPYVAASVIPSILRSFGRTFRVAQFLIDYDTRSNAICVENNYNCSKYIVTYLSAETVCTGTMSEDSSGFDGTEDISVETAVLGVRAPDDARVETLVDAVMDISASNEFAVIVAYIFDKDSHNETIKQVVGAEGEHVEPDELASRMSVVRTITDRLEAASIDVETRAAPGTNGDGIVDIAEDVDADRVLIGGRRRSPAGKALFGSTVQTVLFNAPCPVTFVRDQD